MVSSFIVCLMENHALRESLRAKDLLCFHAPDSPGRRSVPMHRTNSVIAPHVGAAHVVSRCCAARRTSGMVLVLMRGFVQVCGLLQPQGMCYWAAISISSSAGVRNTPSKCWRITEQPPRATTLSIAMLCRPYPLRGTPLFRLESTHHARTTSTPVPYRFRPP